MSVPSIITGFVTWNVAMHNNKNLMPLEKYKIAYNRIYYPLYLIVSSKDVRDIDHAELQKKFEDIIKKYKKYVACSTEKTYNRYLEDLKLNKIEKRNHISCFKIML